ncbi:MAG TPA: TonB-dependent receptor [Flavisolibacter sp.]|jgi:iron complex outermembrane receptor protein/outer membrane receptor for ferrienterochelin and colicins|nr:TonB-dependent receptor [Flavisolibacter sp.]
MKRTAVLLFIFFFTRVASGQTVKLFIVDSLMKGPIAGATIQTERNNINLSDSSGYAVLNLPEGRHHLIVTATGYQPYVTDFSIPFTDLYRIALLPAVKQLEDITILASTRNNQRIENAPLKVEVLGREEMEEENTIKPANIASILGDISGVQIQQSSAVSGNVNIRIQGLEGRYTQILRDGLPLFEGFSGGFGILSIPPLDLRQIELIKGSASTLYGGGAIGGLVNLISRRPGYHQEGVLTLNQSTLKESNVNSYFARRYKSFGYSFFGGFTRQQKVDVNEDGFSDVPQLRATVVHPRLFFYPNDKITIIAGYTVSLENRLGGDMQVLDGNSNSGHQYFERNRTARHSGEWLYEQRLSGNKRLDLKASVSSFNRTITTNTHYFKGNQVNYYTEASLLIPYGPHSFVGGINALGERFRKLPSDPITLENFSNHTIGVFMQNTWQFKETTIVEAGLRDDYQFTYGNFLLPRLALLHHFNESWAGRAGIGFGYKTPNPLAPQIADFDIEDIDPMPANIPSETSIGYNLELNYKKEWGAGNTLFINHAFFLTRINDPIVTDWTSGRLIFFTGPKPVVSKGFDTYVRAVLQGWELYAGYTFTIAQMTYRPINASVPYTPQHRAAFTLVRDFEKKGWRLGLEGSYTGPQFRRDYSSTPAYVFLAAMVEKRIGKQLSIVLNGENLLDYRQSREESLYTGPTVSPQFVPLWAPIDGRVINLSLKWNFFAAD